MWFNQLKTTILLASLMGLAMFLGSLLGGYNGLIAGLIIAVLVNGFAYFYSDKIVLKMYSAKPLDSKTYGWIYDMIHELATKNDIPMPKLWLIETPMANAFATGRNPKHASIALTSSIIEILSPEELRGVLAHEISHVVNRDILISSVAAIIASAIGFVANMMRYSAFWQNRSGNSERENRINPIAMLIIAIIIPIVASLIQLAISRSREYLADESGSEISQDPLALASALEKLQKNIAYDHLKDSDTRRATTAHLFIVNPFTGRGLTALFATHPPMQERIERLHRMYAEMKVKK